MRDSRTFQARWNGSVTRPRSASGTPTPSSSTVTASHAPSTAAPITIGLPSGAYLRALPTRLESTWPTRPTSTSSGGRSAGAVDDEPLGAARDIELAAQPRDERRERRRRSLEDQRVGLEVRHVEHLVDERGQPAAGLVDALDVGALLVRLELEVQQRLGVARG